MVRRGFAETRHKARGLIMAGVVEVEGTAVDKPGTRFPDTAVITLKPGSPPYVSRGGLKLEAALRHFDVDVAEKTVLDVGASTGGFTDCLLQHGARRVLAVDVGYGQLAWKLRQDPRVWVLERTNARYLTPQDLPQTPQGAVIDVSFISLRLVVPPVSTLLSSRAFVIALVKPQFEAGKGQVGKGGVVRDPRLHDRILAELTGLFQTLGWRVEGHIPSPLLGPKGNREFLVHMSR